MSSFIELSLDFIAMSILHLLMFSVLLILLIPVGIPLFSLYIRIAGVETKATLKLTPRKYRITRPKIGKYDEGILIEVSAAYKVNKMCYERKPLNDPNPSRYENRQSVTIKYLKQNPKCFIVI